MFLFIKYLLLQLYGYLTFGVRVHVWGWFTVANKKNVKLGRGCSINQGVFILGRDDIAIGNNVTLSARCMLLDAGLDVGGLLDSGQHVRKHTKSFIHIEDNVWIGAGAIILAGITVHKNSIVGAGSIVTRDVPEGVVVAGNPARIIRKSTLQND